MDEQVPETRVPGFTQSRAVRYIGLVLIGAQLVISTAFWIGSAHGKDYANVVVVGAILLLNHVAFAFGWPRPTARVLRAAALAAAFFGLAYICWPLLGRGVAA